MKLSIIIPCYNVADYIEQCLQSILPLAHQSYEFILINDGSGDATGEILERYKEQYQKTTRIHVLHQENQGLSATRNKGIALATGTYICFIDSDDWVAANYLQTLEDTIEKGYDLVAVSYTRVFQQLEQPRQLNMGGVYEPSRIKQRLIGLTGNELRDPSQADSLVTLWGKIYKREIIIANEIQIKDINEIGTAEDLIFNLEYISKCIQPVYVIDEPLYFYRKTNTGSFTQSYKPELYSKWQRLFHYVEAAVQNQPEREAFQNRIALSTIGLGLNEMGNPEGKKAIKHKLKSILSDTKYQIALQQLHTQYLPLHWKLFFNAAKKGHVTLLYWLLKSIAGILNRKNNG